MIRVGAAAFIAFAVASSACGATSVPLAASETRTSTGPSAAPTQPAATIPSSSGNSFDAILPPAGPISDSIAAGLTGIACVGPIGSSDPVAIVQLHSGTAVLRDYVDPAHPRTACAFPPNFNGQLIDAHHVVSGGQGYLYAVIDLPSVTYHWFQLPSTPDDFPTLIAVSPGLDAVAYLVNHTKGDTDDVHVATRIGDRVVATLPNPHGGRCGAFDDSMVGAYTHSGKDVYVLDQPHRTLNSLVVLQGDQTELKLTPPAALSQGWPTGAQPSMPVWSSTSETLYYSKDGDVWKLVPGGKPERFLAGVTWLYPTISADGYHLAYAVVRGDGLHNIYLVDLAARGTPQLIGKGARTTPVFLNSTQIWYRAESQGICGPGGSAPLVYDLADGSEAPSIVDFVSSVWPATSSNF